jgi:hypothetical protein
LWNHSARLLEMKQVAEHQISKSTSLGTNALLPLGLGSSLLYESYYDVLTLARAVNAFERWRRPGLAAALAELGSVPNACLREMSGS